MGILILCFQSRDVSFTIHSLFSVNVVTMIQIYKHRLIVALQFGWGLEIYVKKLKELTSRDMENIILYDSRNSS